MAGCCTFLRVKNYINQNKAIPLCTKHVCRCVCACRCVCYLTENIFKAAKLNEEITNAK